MLIEDIQIHTGAVDFEYTPVRRLEARCEAPTAFSKAPTIDDVNQKLREMAASLGANAVVDVRYDSGVTWTSWRSLRGYGLAVKRLSDEMACPVCAESIKRAAKKCRFCGAEIASVQPLTLVQDEETSANVILLEEEARGSGDRVSGLAFAKSSRRSTEMEVLRSTDNPQTWIIVGTIVAALLFLFGLLM